jgi:hypothetical protein
LTTVINCERSPVRVRARPCSFPFVGNAACEGGRRYRFGGFRVVWALFGWDSMRTLQIWTKLGYRLSEVNRKRICEFGVIV